MFAVLEKAGGRMSGEEIGGGGKESHLIYPRERNPGYQSNKCTQVQLGKPRGFHCFVLFLN